MGDQGLTGAPDGVRYGFYGKIPSRGDFVGAGLPRAFVAPWDGWLQELMAGSQARLGDGFAAAWDAAPAWRFRLAPGCCGPLAAGGVLTPSADRVGRRFPLTIACVWSAVEAGIGPTDDWLGAAERLGRAATGAHNGPDDLIKSLRLMAPEFARQAHRAEMEQGGGRWCVSGRPAGLAAPALPTVRDFIEMIFPATATQTEDPRAVPCGRPGR